jgi:GNAT superfamily N-acetyltransferase
MNGPTGIPNTNDGGLRLGQAPLTLNCEQKPGRRENVEAILGLITSLGMQRPNAEQEGFLRLRHKADEYQRFTDAGHVTVASLGGRTVGFLLAFPWESGELALERQLVGAVSWTDRSYSNSDNPIYRKAIFIAEVGVDPALARKGIGRHLYAELVGRHPDAHLITTIMEEPLSNEASAAFHTSLGFVRVGFWETSEFFDLRPYRCGIYLRRP